MVQIGVKNTEIITTKDNFGGEFKYLKLGFVKGKNQLKKVGFETQPNSRYMKKDNEYFHYNKLYGIWIYEKINENKSTVFTGEY